MDTPLSTSSITTEDSDLCAEVIRQSGQPVSSCYQCQRCGGGCPVAYTAGTTPNQFLRLVQLGLVDEAMRSPLMWLCVGCGTCGARCPNRISTNAVIDAFRARTLKRKAAAKQVRSIRTFHKIFLRQVKRFGRLHEPLLIAALKMKTGRFFNDLGLGLRMFRKGKIGIMPHSLRGIRDVKRVFKARRAAR